MPIQEIHIPIPDHTDHPFVVYDIDPADGSENERYRCASTGGFYRTRRDIGERFKVTIWHHGETQARYYTVTEDGAELDV